MPYLLLRTNQPIDREKEKSLLTGLSANTAQALGKPERFVMVSLERERPMLFAGNDAPCAYLELKSISLPEQKTTELSAALCEQISTELAIPADRIYIEFADAQRHMWGWNSGTFER